MPQTVGKGFTPSGGFCFAKGNLLAVKAFALHFARKSKAPDF